MIVNDDNDGDDDDDDDDDDNDDEVPHAEWVPLPCRPKKHRQWNILPLGLDFSTPDKQSCLYLLFVVVVVVGFLHSW